MITSTFTETTVQVYQVFIKASADQVWDAITKPEFTTRYFHGARVENTPELHLVQGPDGEDWATARRSSSTRRAGSCTTGSRSTTPSSPRSPRAA